MAETTSELGIASVMMHDTYVTSANFTNETEPNLVASMSAYVWRACFT